MLKDDLDSRINTDAEKIFWERFHAEHNQKALELMWRVSEKEITTTDALNEAVAYLRENGAKIDMTN